VYYKSKIYQLNSLRLGLIHEDNIYGKPTIFSVIGSQTENVLPKIEYLKKLHDNGTKNIIALPVDINGSEPGDNYEIYSYYENFLDIKFYVTEKLSTDHIFFKHFGEPKMFSQYHFNDKTEFVRKLDE
tara:strand:- start:823 stop:1206 length:384 start_codon:yes stop_codon:yes gene_type:complete